jgi:Flp pilus assembly protein TadB
MKRSVAYLLVLAMGFPLSMWSQSQAANPPETQKQLLEGAPAANAKGEVQKRGAGERSRVRITLRNQSEVKGYISQIDADTFKVTDRKSGHVTTIAYQDITRIRGGGMSTGAKIAIVTGIGVAVIVILVVLHSQLNHS